MKKLIQTRLHSPPNLVGNCYPTVIACIMDKNSPEDVIQIQERYEDEEGWGHLLQDWLEKEGWENKDIEGHLYNNEFYFVSGNTERGTYHITIYQNGELFHDPHPSNKGLIEEDRFEQLVKI